MKKLIISSFVFFVFLVDSLSARGVGIGVGFVRIPGSDMQSVAHLTAETYSRLGDGIVVGGMVLNLDGYEEGTKGQMISVEGGIGILADKKLNLYASAGLAHQANSSTDASASLGIGYGIGLSYRLTKETYVEIKYRSFDFSNDLNGEVDDYEAAITSIAVAYMF